MKKPLALFGISTRGPLLALLCALSLLLVTSGGAASLPHSAQDGDRVESNIGPGLPAGQKFTTSLSPLQEVPTPVGTLIGKGSGVVTLNAAETQIIVSLNYNSLGSNAISAHIHGSATSTPGNTGPILFDLMPTGGTAGTNTATQFAITPAQVALLRQGLMYFNVHTINNNSGEIRGQIHLNDASRNFDADGRTDYAVYRPSQGTWFILLSSTNTLQAGLWGSANDTIVPGDYDGDARTDFAVFRGGVWYIQPNVGGNSTARQFGFATDIPVPADYDKDGKTDIAVFRPSDGNWYILRSSDGSFSAQKWGLDSDRPVPGDYDGDGRADLAVFRPSSNTFYVLGSLNGALHIFQLGVSGDVPVPGDYNGDGRTDPAVFRPSTSTWFTSLDPANNYGAIQWGATGDTRVQGDYDSDGKTDVGVWRPTAGAPCTYFVRVQFGGLPGLADRPDAINNFQQQQWGSVGDKALTYVPEQ